MSTGLSFVPAPAANTWSAMVLSHARMELRLLVRNGEQLLLALVIPLLLLTGGAESTFAFMYILVIVGAAFVLGRGALVAAAAAVLLYVGDGVGGSA